MRLQVCDKILNQLVLFFKKKFNCSHDWCRDACNVPFDCFRIGLEVWRKSCYLGFIFFLFMELQTLSSSCANACQCIFVLGKWIVFLVWCTCPVGKPMGLFRSLRFLLFQNKSHLRKRQFRFHRSYMSYRTTYCQDLQRT